MNDIELLRQNYLSSCQDAEFCVDEKTAYNLLSMIKEDGSFPDIDYVSAPASSWQVLNHLSRLKSITSNKSILSDNANVEMCRRALRYFLDGNFHNSNWWYMQIGIQRELGDVAICLYDYLDESERASVLRCLEQGSLIIRPVFSNWTGANLVWMCFNTIKHGIFAGDVEIVRAAVLRLEKEFVIKTGWDGIDAEGIRSDFSFFQHGTQLYTYGYGASFNETAARIVYTLRGTELQLSKDSLKLLGEFVIFGLRYCVKNNTPDYLTGGREFQREYFFKNNSLREALLLYLNTPEMYARDYIQEFIASLSTESYALTGDKYFEQSDYYVCKRKSIHISSRVNKTRLHLGESINNENFLSCNLYAGGATCIITDGAEYDDLIPVLDYAKIPGTTAPADNDEELSKKVCEFHGRFPDNKYSGGFSNGHEGYIFQDLNYSGVTGVISRFFIDGMLVSMGSGINYTGNNPLATTINQCKTSGDVLTFDDGKAVYHHRVGYLSLDEKTPVLNISTRTGSYSRNETNLPEIPVTGEVLTLYFDHGENPQNACYAYAVIPSLSCENAKKRFAQVGNALKIISNTPDLQAVEYKNKLYCVFHKACALHTEKFGTIRAGAHCGCILG